MFNRALRLGLRRQGTVPSYGNHSGYGFNKNTMSRSYMNAVGKIVTIAQMTIIPYFIVSLYTKSPHRGK